MKNIDTFIIKTKALVRKNFSPATIEWIKKFLGKLKFDEVDVIYTVVADKINSKVMIDIGAHYGESFGSFIYDGWDIYAFEPDTENMKILNLFVNSRGKLVLDKRACGNNSAKNQPFFRSDISSGISSLSSFHSSHFCADQVDTVTLSDYVEEQQITEIGFLKIDTEGHDLFVLQGVSWEKVKPEIIVCEFEDRKTEKLGYTFKDLANFLGERGYKVLVSEWAPITEYGQSHTWKKLHEYPCSLDSRDAWGNIIAVKDDEIYKSLLEYRIN